MAEKGGTSGGRGYSANVVLKSLKGLRAPGEKGIPGTITVSRELGRNQQEEQGGEGTLYNGSWDKGQIAWCERYFTSQRKAS